MITCENTTVVSVSSCFFSFLFYSFFGCIGCILPVLVRLDCYASCIYYRDWDYLYLYCSESDPAAYYLIVISIEL